MAVIDVVTQAGLDLNAQSFTPGNRPHVTAIKVGTGHVTSEAAAIALSDLVAHTSAYDHNNPPVEAEGNEAQTTYVNTDRTQQYPINEIGVFSGNTLIKYVCSDDGTPLLTKSVGLTLLIPLRIRYSNGDAQLQGVSYAVTPLATKLILGLMRFATLVEEGTATSEDVGVTVAGVRRMIGELGATLVEGSDAEIDAAAQGRPPNPTNANYVSVRGLVRWFAARTIELAKVSGLTAALARLAPLESPAFRGSPTVPTAPERDASTRAVNTRWVWNQGIRREISATLFDSSFPSSPSTGQNVFFAEAVPSGLNWRDTNGTTILASAAAGDWAQWTGTIWRKQVTQAGDKFLIPE